MSFAAKLARVSRGPAVILVCLLLAWQLTLIAKRAQFSPGLLVQAFVVRAGAEHSVPANARDAAQLLLRNHINTFRLSDNLHSDVSFLQRIVEFAFPARLDNDARHLLTEGMENGKAITADHCVKLDASAMNTLYDCVNSN